MRDLFVFAVVMMCLPVAFRRPFIGLLLFSWLAYMRPQDLCWSFARTMRFSFLAALVMLVGWFANESQVRRFWKPDPRTVAMLVLAVLTTISLSMARESLGNEYVMRYYFEFIKIIMIALFTTGQVDTRQRLRLLLWTICGCLAFYGIKGGVFGVLSGGSPILRGPGGMLEDNNDFALALVMNIPLLYYLGRAENSVLLRRGCDAAAGLTVITILLTHSRGAFLASTGTMCYIAWRSGKLIQAGFVLLTLAALFFLLAPSHVVNRIASIGEGAQESSAAARIRSWKVALRMIRRNPVFGVGLRNFREHYAENSDQFEEGKTFAYVAHNSYLQIWAEGGTLSFIVYLCLLGSVFVAGAWLRRLATLRVDLEWVGVYARMMEATTFGFMIGAVFLNRGHFDLIYHWFALVSCLVYVARVQLATGPEPSAAADRGVEVRWRSRARSALRPRWGR